MRTLHSAHDGRDRTTCCDLPFQDVSARGEAVAYHLAEVTCTGQVRPQDAPVLDPGMVDAALTQGWTPPAAHSLAAAIAAKDFLVATAAAARTRPALGDRWSQFDRSSGARERNAVLASQVELRCAERVIAWAATLPTAQERTTALAAADVIKQGR